MMEKTQCLIRSHTPFYAEFFATSNNHVIFVNIAEGGLRMILVTNIDHGRRDDKSFRTIVDEPWRQ